MKEACHDGYMYAKMESAITTNLVSGSVLNRVFSRSVLNVTACTVLKALHCAAWDFRIADFSVVVMLHL